MHSHDRTLISELGADIDHKTPEHDQACLYLQSKAVEIARLFHPVKFPAEGRRKPAGLKWEFECRKIYYTGELEVSEVNFRWHLSDIQVQTTLESIITKGNGDYRRHIGFIDLLLRTQSVGQIVYDPFDVQYKMLGQWRPDTLAYDYTDHVIHLTDYVVERVFDEIIAIEVKTRFTPIGDLIRQVKLYKTYSPNPSMHWMVGTTFDLDSKYVAALKNEGIDHVRISDDFRAMPKPLETSSSFGV